jgi:hypothetical protein
VAAGDLDCGELSIEPGSGTCRLIIISRQVARAGRFFPRFFLITITGDSNCSFSRQSDVDFGTSDINATTLGTLGNRVISLVTVKPKATSYTYDVTVDGFSGVKFTIR